MNNSKALGASLRKYIICGLFSCVSLYGLANTTQYSYDARGRLIQVVKDSEKINYSYDRAGNRMKVDNGTKPPVISPTISQFSAPATVPANTWATITWTAKMQPIVTWPLTTTPAAILTYPLRVPAPFISGKPPP